MIGFLIVFINNAASASFANTKYSILMTEVEKNWINLAPKNCANTSEKIKIQVYELTESTTYVAAAQNMCIANNLEVVVGIVQDYDHYADLFPDLKSVHVMDHKGNNIDILNWTVRVPVFFIPNFQYQMEYIRDLSNADHKFFRYRLIGGEKLKASDGLIAIDRVSSSKTNYTELDFFDADWGLLKSLSPRGIVRNGLKDVIASDISILLKGENLSWSNEKSRDKAVQQTEEINIDRMIEQKVKFKGIESIKEFSLM